MTFLPIVERELRVATRRRRTYWLRVIAAGVALLIGSGMMLLSLLPFVGQTQSGSAMFTTLTWMSLAAALSAGLFFTSDCLSEEKREGTLGFLFLTDLRGYDVVLGKLLATSLRSVSPLLAIFPVLATTLLLGGVDVAHFWRTLLAVGNAAFFSLSLGLLVSAMSRHPLKALATTLILLLLFLGGGPLVDNLWGLGRRNVGLLSLASPGYTFAAAERGDTFWRALLVSDAVAWLLLGLACFLVRRTWQERPGRSWSVRLPQRFPLRSVGLKQRRRRHAKLLEKNPVTWLVARERGHAWGLWGLTLLMMGGFLILVLAGFPRDWLQGWSFINRALSLVLYLWVTAKACQLFAEARRSGALELLLASPLTSRETVQGAWQGLLWLFAPQVLLLFCFELGAGVLTGGLGQGLVASGQEFGWVAVVAMVLNAAVIPMNLVALAWFGLWMGLTSRGGLTATLKTIAFVQIIPWFVIYLITGLAVPLLLLAGVWSAGGSAPSQSSVNYWLPLFFVGLPAGLALIKGLFFWTLARRRLFGKFRQLATRSILPTPTFNVPPVIRTVS